MKRVANAVGNAADVYDLYKSDQAVQDALARGCRREALPIVVETAGEVSGGVIGGAIGGAAAPAICGALTLTTGPGGIACFIIVGGGGAYVGSKSMGAGGKKLGEIANDSHNVQNRGGTDCKY